MEARLRPLVVPSLKLGQTSTSLARDAPLLLSPPMLCADGSLLCTGLSLPRAGEVATVVAGKGSVTAPWKRLGPNALSAPGVVVAVVGAGELGLTIEKRISSSAMESHDELEDSIDAVDEMLAGRERGVGVGGCWARGCRRCCCCCCRCCEPNGMDGSGRRLYRCADRRGASGRGLAEAWVKVVVLDLVVAVVAIVATVPVEKERDKGRLGVGKGSRKGKGLREKAGVAVLVGSGEGSA